MEDPDQTVAKCFNLLVCLDEGRSELHCGDMVFDGGRRSESREWEDKVSFEGSSPGQDGIAA